MLDDSYYLNTSHTFYSFSIHRNLVKTTGAILLLFDLAGKLHPRHYNTV